ncbi:MAG: hypothetical protein U0R64_00385 [Candidatus Nanopelagicales bacterium]
MQVTDSDFATARSQLHTVAEWLLAGPQFATSATIKLRADDGMLRTVAPPDIVLSADGLTVDGVTHPLRDTVSQLGAAAGLPCERPEVVYRDPAPGDLTTALTASQSAYAAVLHVFTVGHVALTQFADEVPIVWPEHFDMAITRDGVTYGVSPGDSFSDRPYAYVSPGRKSDDAFWNAPFGAALPFHPDEPGASSRIRTLFDEGRTITSS